MTVDVVHAGVDRLWRCRIVLPIGSTAQQAVEAAGFLEQLPLADREPLRLGVFSRRIDASRVLRDGDRVEIYRPLQLDPMAARRRRADENR